MLSVAMTCASAGIIVGVVTLTGLGLKFSSIVLDYADCGAHALVSFWALFGAERTPVLLHDMQPAAHGVLHLAHRLDRRPRGAGHGVLHHLRGDRRAGDDRARRARFRRAHVHLLLRGALRSVAADRAVAICGGGDHRRRIRIETTMQCWKYTTPAFLMPFMFVLDPSGTGLLLTGSFKTLGQAGLGLHSSRDDHRGVRGRRAGRAVCRAGSSTRPPFSSGGC